MSFMTLDIILFRKKNQNYYILLPFSFFVYLLPSLTNKWLHNTLSVFEEGAIEYNLRAKIWLDGFDSVFWQVSIDILFVVFLFVLFSRLKNEKEQVLMPFYRNIGNRKPLGFFT